MTAHAALAPSAAARWSRCAAAPLMERGAPDDAGVVAHEGAAAHAAAALALLLGAPAQARGALPAEQAWAAQVFVDYVLAIIDKDNSASVFLETPIKIDEVTGENGAHGTPDVVIVCADCVHILDYKHGSGVEVAVRDNEQLLVYGIAALQKYGQEKELRLHIVQPRKDNIQEWRPKTSDIIRAHKHFRAQGARALALLRDADTPRLPYDFAPSEKACRFCKAKAKCPALRAKAESALGAPLAKIAKAENADAFLPATQDNAALAEALAAAPILEQWCAAVKSAAFAALAGGAQVQGYKLVHGRRARAWRDDAAAAAAMTEAGFSDADIYTRRIISPATFERKAKEAGKGDYVKTFAEHIVTASAKPVIAPECDTRPAINAAGILQDFPEALKEA